MTTNLDLYEIVSEYHALGDHRTGTEVDAATVRWMAEWLERVGLTATVEPYEFDRWQAESTLLADGAPVEHLPVFHEFDGEVTTRAPRLITLDPLFGGFAEVLAEPITAAQRAGADALIVATEHPEGSLVAINRTPGRGRGLPTVLVAGREYGRLRAAAELELHLKASTGPG